MILTLLEVTTQDGVLNYLQKYSTNLFQNLGIDSFCMQPTSKSSKLDYSLNFLFSSRISYASLYLPCQSITVWRPRTIAQEYLNDPMSTRMVFYVEKAFTNISYFVPSHFNLNFFFCPALALGDLVTQKLAFQL